MTAPGAAIRLGSALFGFALLCSQFACSARRSEPVAGPLPITTAQTEQGQKLFMLHCQQCHPGGEAGLGPALNNKPLPSFLITFQVRHGLGAMPAFSEEEITASQLDAIVAYLHALRSHG